MAVTANYNLSGLFASTQYNIYNTTPSGQSNPFNLTTDSAGSLNFSIRLSALVNTGIIVNTTTSTTTTTTSTTTTTTTIISPTTTQPTTTTTTISTTTTQSTTTSTTSTSTTIPICFDSDGGPDIYLKGTVITNAGNTSDSCVNSNTVAEWICGNFDTAEMWQLFCPGNYTCTDGACVSQITTTTTTSTTTTSTTIMPTTTSTITTTTSTTSTTILLCSVKGDQPPCDGLIDDWELLDYIKQWAKGLVPDFDLLEAIKNWAEI